MSTLSTSAHPADVSSLITPTAPASVHLEGSVVLSMVKHAREQSPKSVYGKLVGHIVGDVLQVTRGSSVSAEQDQTNDSIQPAYFEGHPCGLYSSTSLDDNDDLHEMCGYMALYQRSNPASVLILYNPALTQRGILSLRVVRVSQVYLDLQENNGKLTAERCREYGLTNPTDILQDVHFSIHNSHLVTAYLFELFTDEKSSHLISSNAEILNPAPTKVAGQLLEKLLDKNILNMSGTAGSANAQPAQPLLDSYTYALERYQRENAYLTRQKTEYARKCEEVRLDNQRRATASLNPLSLPEQPQFNEPSLHDIQLYSVRVNNAARELHTVTELAHMKQLILKKLVTAENFQIE
jgi:hypothetical protein